MKHDQLLESLIAAVRSISHGDAHGPTGLEGVAMALSGGGNFEANNLSGAIRDAGESIGNGLHALAEAIGQT